MKKYLLIIFCCVIFLFLVLVGAEVVYQENANATACVGSWLGTQPCSNVYDGSWSTYGASGGPDYAPYYYANYSIPEGVENLTSTWRVADSGGSVNLNIPLTCWGGSVLELRVRTRNGPSHPYYVKWACLNRTSLGWDVLRDDYDERWPYEELMNWNITEVPPTDCWSEETWGIFTPTGCVYEVLNGEVG